MLRALGDALPAAIAIAVSPISIVLVILTLVSARARVNGPAFAAGWTVSLFVLTSVVYLLADSGDVATDEAASDGANIVQIGIGVMFFALAARQWRKRPRAGVEQQTPKLFAAVDSLTGPKAFLIGVVGIVVNPKNLLLAVSGGVSIAQTAPGDGGFGAVALFTLIASCTVLGAVIATVALGDRIRQPLDQLKEWLLANNATIMLVLFVLLGAKALGSGLAITT